MRLAFSQEMTAGPQPLDVIAERLQHFARDIAAVEQGPPYHLAGVGGMVGTIQCLTKHRAQHGRKVETYLAVNLNLSNTVEMILDWAKNAHWRGRLLR